MPLAVECFKPFPLHIQAQRNGLLRLLAPEDFASLEPALSVCSLEAGQILGRPGEIMEQVYFPTSGIISVLAVLTDGRSVETAMVGHDGGVGLIAAITGSRCKNLLRVQTPGEALAVSAAAFQAHAQQSSAIRSLVAQHTERMHGQTVQAAACNALCSAETRIARWLLMCLDRAEGDTVPMRQEELADTLGLQRTTVTSAARSLQAKGCIVYRRGNIRVLTRDGLIEAANGCYAPEGPYQVR